MQMIDASDLLYASGYFNAIYYCTSHADGRVGPCVGPIKHDGRRNRTVCPETNPRRSLPPRMALRPVLQLRFRSSKVPSARSIILSEGSA